LTTEEELRLQAENLDLRRLLQQAGMNAAERRTVEVLQNLLVAELHHRIKNILSAIASQSLRPAETDENARKAIEQRLAALGRSSPGAPRLWHAMIRQSFVNQLHGAVRLSFAPSGVACEIDIPLAAISAPAPSETGTERD
jgi:HWE histidine kinase